MGIVLSGGNHYFLLLLLALCYEQICSLCILYLKFIITASLLFPVST